MEAIPLENNTSNKITTETGVALFGLKQGSTKKGGRNAILWSCVFTEEDFKKK